MANKKPIVNYSGIKKELQSGDKIAGSDLAATTADITDSSNKRYVTDAQLTVIGNTSGTNTGDQNLSSYATQAYADAKIEDAINDGTTTKAPSENAVFDALALKAPLASPALSGTPTAPTASVGANTTQIATTAFVLANAGGFSYTQILLTQIFS